MPLNRVLEGLSQLFEVGLARGDVAIGGQGRLVPLHKLALAGLVVVARWEKLDLGADVVQTLQLGGDEEVAIAVSAPVQGVDADVVARNEKVAVSGVVDDKGEDAVEELDELGAQLVVEVEQGLAVGLGLEIVRLP